MKVYSVRLTRTASGWTVAIPDLAAEVHVRTIRDATPAARLLIVSRLDGASDAFDVHLHIETVGDVSDIPQKLEEIRDAKEAAELYGRAASTKLRGLAVTLTAQGLPLRDTAAIIGISGQRVDQILRSELRKGTADSE